MESDPIPDLKRQIGAELATQLQGWRGSDIAYQLRTQPARISDLRRGRLERFSLETLIRFLTRLRYRVELKWMTAAEQQRLRNVERQAESARKLRQTRIDEQLSSQ